VCNVADQIDTRKVGGRRGLRFDSLDAILADVEMLEKAKRVRALGNWSAGQNVAHVALLMTRSLDGFPGSIPWFVRMPVRLLMKGTVLNKPMSAGFKTPKAVGSPPEPVSLEDGLAQLRAAIGRLKAESKRAPSPLLGRLSVEEWNQLHCRHAELHLSFLVPEE
jgi:hypothetical protein